MGQKQSDNIIWNQGADAQSLAENLAGELVGKIREAINSNGSAVIALSGGSTPKPLFRVLAQHDIEWSKVIITLVDERWVPEEHELSNAAFMRENLFDLIPEEVQFVPLYQQAQTVEASFQLVLNEFCAVTESTLDNLRAFDIVILGMGGDGHTASFFPDADNVSDLISIEIDKPLLTCSSASTQVERITWSLPVLLNTSFLALHFTGQEKLAVFEAAAAGGKTEELPIRCAIFQNQTPLHIYYAD
ncbi:MAG: 6-phosphogluconolactonase [Gammaproteobacteria bacterium]|nr:6-phosphogluconolactonase [Gammaproteobacteria bacterium]